MILSMYSKIFRIVNCDNLYNIYYVTNMLRKITKNSILKIY